MVITTVAFLILNLKLFILRGQHCKGGAAHGQKEATITELWHVAAANATQGATAKLCIYGGQSPEKTNLSKEEIAFQGA